MAGSFHREEKVNKKYVLSPWERRVTPVIAGLQAEYTTLIEQAEKVAPSNPIVQKARGILDNITPENRRQSLIQIEALEDELKSITGRNIG